MSRKIFTGMLILSLITTVLTSALVCGTIYNRYLTGMKDELKNKTSYIAAIVEKETDIYSNARWQLKPAITGCRITLISSDGTVLYDNTANAAEMENHSGRPEIKDALLYGKGENTRFSDTLNTQTYYYALEIASGRILRLSFTTYSALSVVYAALPFIFAIFAVMIAVSVFMARRQTKIIIAPINSIDLEKPEITEAYAELTPLLSRIHLQKKQILEQFHELEKIKIKFDAITENMSDGLIILDEKGRIMTANKGAIKSIGIKGNDYTGKPFLNIIKKIETHELVEAVLKSGNITEGEFEFKERRLRVRAAPARENGTVIGATIFIFDDTARYENEKMRREFTANVSHELKTPLTVISGYAEIISSGMAKPEDITGFASGIITETKRLLSMIDEIILLSKLDEKNSGYLHGRAIDLLEAARTAVERNRPAAEKRSISIDVSGESTVVHAVPELLSELIGNLVDNAIKYNREGGLVSVNVSQDGGGYAVLKVSDTGIGIGPEHIKRIFERFYRVERGRSGTDRGTGLGLAIVKHAADYHNAAIEIDSKPGSGTEIRIKFNPAK